MATELYARRDVERAAYIAARNTYALEGEPTLAIETLKRIAGDAVGELDRELEAERQRPLLDPEAPHG